LASIPLRGTRSNRDGYGRPRTEVNGQTRFAPPPAALCASDSASHSVGYHKKASFESLWPRVPAIADGEFAPLNFWIPRTGARMIRLSCLAWLAGHLASPRRHKLAVGLEARKQHQVYGTSGVFARQRACPSVSRWVFQSGSCLHENILRLGLSSLTTRPSAQSDCCAHQYLGYARLGPRAMPVEAIPHLSASRAWMLLESRRLKSAS